MASVTSYTIRGSELIGKIVLSVAFPISLGLLLLLWIWKTDERIGSYAFGGAIALIGWFLAGWIWMYGRDTRRKLAASRRLEKSLRAQTTLLQRRIKSQRHELHQSQIEEIQQMYRVAELGQAGVTLLHDLANHLSVLTLEVEGLQAKQQSQEVDRIKKAIHYLESIVDDTRGRLHGEMRVQTFDIVGKVREIVAFLRYKAIKANVVVDWHPNAQEVNCRGDMARFCQLIAYIISNAIDAYDEKSISISTSAHRVVVSMECNDTIAIIRIRDWGKGIPKNVRKNLFKPFRSTKKHGLGLGLFIAKQIIETNFSGSITLNPTFEYTEFIVTIPVEAKV